MIERLFFLLAATVVLSVQQPVSAPGTIRGTVVRQGTAEPVAGAIVSVNVPDNCGDCLLDLPDNEADLLAYLTQVAQQSAAVPAAGGFGDPFSAKAQTMTDSLGNFTFDHIPPGRHSISAQLEGYFGPPQNGNVTTVVQVPVTVGSGQTADVKLALIPGGAISGRVYDTVGMPQSDTLVQVYRFAYQDGLAFFQPGNGKSTDDHGDYRIYHLPPGEYFLAAAPRPYPGAFGADVPGNNNAGLVPLKTFFSDTTDPSLSTPIIIRGGDEISGANISMKAANGATVSGRILSELPAIVHLSVAGQTRDISNAAATLTITPHDRNSLIDFNGSTHVSMTAPNTGKFEFRNVPPGTYDLLAGLTDPSGFGTQNPPGKATGPIGYGRATVEVRGKDVEGISFTVHSGTDIHGRITVDGGAIAASAVRVSLQSNDSASSNAVYRQVGRFQPAVDVEGRFTIPSVPEGSYRFQVSDAGGWIGVDASLASLNLARDTYVADIRQGNISVYDNGIHVGEKSAGDVEVILRSGAGTIQGTLLGADHKPAVSTMVVAVPPVGRRQNAALYKTALSDMNGKFTISGVVPGNYQLFSWQDYIAGAAQNADYLQKYDGRGTTVAVPVAAAVTAEVQVIPAAVR